MVLPGLLPGVGLGRPAEVRGGARLGLRSLRCALSCLYLAFAFVRALTVQTNTGLAFAFRQISNRETCSGGLGDIPRI